MTKIFNVEIKPETPSEVFHRIDEALFDRKSKKLSIVTLNPEILLLAEKNPDYQLVLNAMNVKTIDGIGLKYALFVKDFTPSFRLTGVELVDYLLKKTKQENRRVGIVLNKNGLSKELDILNFIKKNDFNASKFEIFTISVQQLASFDLNKIGKKDILLVALGAPFQEILINRLKKSKAQVKIAVGVGGAIDYLTGMQTPPPTFIKKIGLEWFWRFILQPKRFQRTCNALVIFPFKVFKKW